MRSYCSKSQLMVGISALALLAGVAVAQAASRPACALVAHVEGTAEYWAVAQKQWQPLKPGIVLPEGLTIRTGANSTLDLGLTTHALVRLSANSRVRLAQMEQETSGLPDQNIVASPHTRLALEQGTVLVRTAKLRRPGSVFAVETPAGVAQATGTGFLVQREGNQISVRVTEDSVSFLIGGQTVTVAAGQQLNIPVDQATGQVTGPTQTVAAPTDDALAQAYQAFQQGTAALATTVFGAGAVSLEQLLQALAAGGSSATAPTLIVIGNPGAVSEISPSTP